MAISVWQAVQRAARCGAMSYVKLGSSLLKLLAAVVVVSGVVYSLTRENPVSTGVMHAQEGPVIHSVEPERLECVVLDSDVPRYRTLTIIGEKLRPTRATRLQFRLPGTNNFTILFGVEVNWESAERITVDMGLIRRHLWNIPKMILQVRLTNAKGDGLTNADLHAYGDVDPHPYSDRHAHGDVDTHSDADSNSNTDPHVNTDADVHSCANTRGGLGRERSAGRGSLAYSYSFN